jgi:hypothetical protein
LARETFEAAEANRAASLRTLLSGSRDWRSGLPPEYWETLRRLESAEADSLRGGEESAERVQQLRGALIRFESQAGTGADLEMPNLLERTRRNLGGGTVLLSFHVSDHESYLWALSRERFALYRLPGADTIAGFERRFEADVRAGRSELADSGYRLFHALFGQLDPAFQNKPHWLLSLDSGLFELPFAALVVGNRAQGPVFLAERHSLAITAGAGMLEASPDRTPPAGPFVGVADAVYNRADPRWTGAHPDPSLIMVSARAATTADDLPLARLAGSAREVSACARAWGGGAPPLLLEGPAASRLRLRAALDSHPAVLHFATHVLPAQQGARSGLIVLSLNGNGQHEVLSPTEISTWNVEGALVTLSGCGSGSADVLPGTGLMGLTRAWEAAGARAVVASRWPGADDSGALFLSFYRYLRQFPRAGPAVALQHAQLDMLRSHNWRSQPLYWAAYFTTSNHDDGK